MFKNLAVLASTGTLLLPQKWLTKITIQHTEPNVSLGNGEGIVAEIPTDHTTQYGPVG